MKRMPTRPNKQKRSVMCLPQFLAASGGIAEARVGEVPVAHHTNCNQTSRWTRKTRNRSQDNVLQPDLRHLAVLELDGQAMLRFPAAFTEEPEGGSRTHVGKIQAPWLD